jgi:hypothetical protein
VAAALAILDVHVARTRTTYASSIQDIAAADRGSAVQQQVIHPK